MTYRDEFDEKPPKKGGFLGTVGPKAAFFVVLIALSFMVGVVWKLYVGGGDSTGQNVPIVRADDNPFKVAPDDPGGMEIPNKDSTIFSSIKEQREADGAQIENLLAKNDDEDPIPRSQLFAGLNTQQNPDLNATAQDTPLDMPMSQDDMTQGEERIAVQVNEAEEIVESFVEDGVESVMPPLPKEIRDGKITDENTKLVMELDAPIPAVTAPVKVESKVEPKVVYKVVDTPEPKVEPKIEPAPVVIKPVETSVPKTAPIASGDYYVQLASVRSRDAAEKEWPKLKKKYSSALSGYAYRIQSADLGAKGMYYRIQAGPTSKTKANSTCSAIKKVTAGGCLVKKK